MESFEFIWDGGVLKNEASKLTPQITIQSQKAVSVFLTSFTFYYWAAQNEEGWLNEHLISFTLIDIIFNPQCNCHYSLVSIIRITSLIIIKCMFKSDLAQLHSQPASCALEGMTHVGSQLESVYQSCRHTGINDLVRSHRDEEEDSSFFIYVLFIKSSTVSNSRFLVFSLYHLVMLSVLQIGCQFSIMSLLCSVLRCVTLMKRHKELQKQTVTDYF